MFFHHTYPKNNMVSKVISIHDTVATAQEMMHSIHVNNIKALIMMIDIHQAYDSIDWSFIRLTLLRVGLSMSSIRWIMACISSIRFVVLVNGLPSNFLMAKRGLRQGCV